MFKDLTGKIFNNLKVIEYSGKSKQNKSLWKCECLLCHNITYSISADLIRGHKVSCGCVRLMKVKEKIVTHNKSYTRLYNIWTDMKQRCYNKNNIAYKNYGDRNITMYDEWKNNFQCFYDWAISNNYSDNLTIDRIDNNKNYEPNNCRWITFKEQQNNRRNNHYMTLKGVTHTIREWSEIVDIPYGTIVSRVNALHWSDEKALTTPVKKGAIKK